MRSNKHLNTFPIALGNQERQKVLSIYITFLVIQFLLLFRHQMTQSAEAHLWEARSVKQNGREEKYCSQTPNISCIERSSGKVQFPPNTFEASITGLSLNSFIIIHVVTSLEMLAKLIQWNLSWLAICNCERRRETSNISFGCLVTPGSYQIELEKYVSYMKFVTR